MKKLVILIGFILAISNVNAQKAKVFATTSSKGIYIEHEVLPKETLYSLSRFYNVKVQQLADMNGFDKNKGLILGEKVKIPLTADNFNQAEKKGTPVYYNVNEKEGLMTVSNKFNKVALKNLRTWNGLKKDELSKDQTVIVGYISAKVNTPTPAVKEEAAKPAEKTTPVIAEKKKEAPKKVEEQPKEEKAPEEIVKKEEPIIVDPTGYFRNEYLKNTNADIAKAHKMEAGTFKTNSGWADKKFYAIADGIAAGTVVRVSNPENGEIVYAKVLGGMDNLQQNKGYQLRISDAAAAALKISNIDKVLLIVTY